MEWMRGWMPDGIKLPDEFRDEYARETNSLLITSVRYVALLIIAVNTLFALVRIENHLGCLHPSQLMIWKAGIYFTTIPIFFITFSKSAQRFAKLIAMLMILSTGFFVAMKVSLIGYDSPYYAVLCLVYFATILLPWGPRWALPLCISTYSFYLVPVLFTAHPHLQSALLLNNNLFQISMIASAGVATFFQSRTHRAEIINRLTIQKQSRELEKQSDAIQKQALEIQHSEKAKRQFIGNVTHDLKTPLSIISGYLDKLRSSIPSSTTDQQRYIGAITDSVIKSCQQLDMLIGVSLLDSEEEKPRFELYEYTSFLRKFSTDFIALAERRGITLSLDIEECRAVASFDPAWMERIVGNLIQNAFKFTEAGGITIRCFKKDSAIITEVIDTGCGIPEEKLGRIFERKYQAHEDKKTLGFGLGLSIVREMTSRMGGEISVSSSVGQGSTFRFSLPLSPDQTAVGSNQSETAISPDTGRIRFFQDQIAQDSSHQALYGDLAELENRKPHLPTILVAEDSPGQLRLIVDSLSDSYNLLLAHNGIQALEKLTCHAATVRLILSDVKMPEMDGLEFCQRVFEDERYRRIPFIFLTAYYNEPEQLKGIQLGATDYLQKPFNEQILREKITHWIARREHERLLDTTIDSLQGRIEQLAKLAALIEHEVKNPLQVLNFIHSAIEQLRRTHYEAADSDQKEQWDYIGQLKSLIETILAVLRTSRSLQDDMANADIKPRRLCSLMDDALAQTSLLVRGISLTKEIQLDAEATVRCDQAMLTQVFVNLIRNAAEAIREKFVQPDGRITIRCRIDEEKCLRVEIADNGVGIEKEAARELFKYRHTTKSDGTGIGLYLSRKILKLHGGDILVRSQPGEGTVFTVQLPMTE
jgi:signal transduction histidine kinase